MAPALKFLSENPMNEDVRINFNNRNEVVYWASKLKVTVHELLRSYYTVGSNMVAELRHFLRGNLNIFNTRDTKDIL